MVNSTTLDTSMKRQVGWFVMLGIGTLLLVLLIMSVRSNVFAKKFYLFVEPPSASAFYEGQPVKFQGFAIGFVDQIELNKQGQVRIALRLLERYRDMLHQGAVLRLTKEGLLGEQTVEVTTGDIKQPVLKHGDHLVYEQETSMEQMLSELKPAVNNANVLLGELAELATWMNDPYGDLRVSMTGLRQITSSVKGKDLQLAVQEFTKTLNQLHQLTRDFNQQHVAAHLKDSLQAASKILKNIEPLSKSIGENAPESVQRVSDLLIHVDELSGALNIVASDLSEMTPELPGLAHESRATLTEMRSLLKKLQHSWLLGGGQEMKSNADKVEQAPPVLDMRP